ncbi:hypothetical protein AKJ64_02375 [candidate division MSBL1 archaeon SCGC-AAA259E17]|uniref:Radical SAM core domain-containing protein n=1 Tax=candidate division MSBL1 archaeon SCGC-AAA259E17 TaxID=1698263 RepID=A0A133UET9_9EURY|nr:hypothetical protein AKJ64_02375 [candidate division MSBL1 archaeon SCGC-AAA259E17]
MDWTSNTSEGGQTVESLERYFSVMKDDLPAKFMICKKTPAEIGLDSEKSKLWKEHGSALEKFESLLRRIDKGETSLDDLKNPETSLLELKAEISKRILKSCHFCERRCGVNRRRGETGVCGVGEDPRVASELVHTGEEPELVPSYTIFFNGCTFECQFCQNWDISQNPDSGNKNTPENISSKISDRRQQGVKNVNWVGGDPTPNLHSVLASLNKCKTSIPSVWNSNMYLSKEGMKLLAGTQDVYLTDFKYGNDKCALKYSKVPNYWEIVSRNHKLAFEDAELIIRHLVLPNHVDCCTKKILEFIKTELDPGLRVNLMDQYRPAAKAMECPEISRRVSKKEMNQALGTAERIGLENVIW